MTSEENNLLDKGAREFASKVTNVDKWNLRYFSFIIGAQSEEAAVYHKEKNKWYAEEEVENIVIQYADYISRCMIGLIPEKEMLFAKEWFEQNKKK